MALTFKQFQELRKKGLTVEQIKNFESGGSPTVQSTSTTPIGRTGLAGFGVGAAKGAGSTIASTQSLGERSLNAITKALLPKRAERALGLDKNKPTIGQNIKSSGLVTPRGTAEKAGFVTEQIAEFFIPAGKIAKAERLVDIAIAGKGLLPALGRIGAKAGVAAAVGGGQTLLQTESAKKAAVAGATGGVIRGITGGIGEGLKAFNIPEKLYSRIFKNTSSDMVKEFKTMGRLDFKNKNPQRFQELVDAGVIKVGADGKTIINETLAKKALDRGLRGSLKNMAYETVRQTDELESTARTLAKSYTKPIQLENQYGAILKEVANEYKGVGFGEVSDEALDLFSKIKSGSATADDVLDLRRFLDGLRLSRSFDVPVNKLSMSQQNFKILADRLRGKLAKIPGFGDVMKEYSFNIDALEAIAREASRRGNNQIFSLIDSVIFGGGFAAGNPIGAATIGAGRRALNSPSALTGIGNSIQSGTPSKFTTGLRGAIGRGASEAVRQNNP